MAGYDHQSGDMKGGEVDVVSHGHKHTQNPSFPLDNIYLSYLFCSNEMRGTT